MYHFEEDALEFQGKKGIVVKPGALPTIFTDTVSTISNKRKQSKSPLKSPQSYREPKHLSCNESSTDFVDTEYFQSGTIAESTHDHFKCEQKIHSLMLQTNELKQQLMTSDVKVQQLTVDKTFLKSQYKVKSKEVGELQAKINAQLSEKEKFNAILTSLRDNGSLNDDEIKSLKVNLVYYHLANSYFFPFVVFSYKNINIPIYDTTIISYYFYNYLVLVLSFRIQLEINKYKLIINFDILYFCFSLPTLNYC